MAEVYLDTQQVQQGLPPVCICCGAHATDYRRKWFIHTPARSIPFAVLGTWRYWRISLPVPLCPAHRLYFTRRWVPLFLVGLLAVVAGVAAYIATDITRGKEAARQ